MMRDGWWGGKAQAMNVNIVPKGMKRVLLTSRILKLVTIPLPRGSGIAAKRKC